MATINTHTEERRHLADRRSGAVTRNESRMNAIDWVAMTLVVIGGINWGLIGLFSFDLVAALFGAMSPLTRLVYALVGFSALYAIYTCTKMSSPKT